MKGLKLELLGIGILLLGIAISTNHFFAYFGGTIGFGIVCAGCFYKEKEHEDP